MTGKTRAHPNVSETRTQNNAVYDACLVSVPAANDNERLLRLPEVLQRIPVSRSTWYQGIKTGLYPKGIRLGARIVAWREADIKKLSESGAQP